MLKITNISFPSIGRNYLVRLFSATIINIYIGKKRLDIVCVEEYRRLFAESCGSLVAIYIRYEQMLHLHDVSYPDGGWPTAATSMVLPNDGQFRTDHAWSACALSLLCGAS